MEKTRWNPIIIMIIGAILGALFVGLGGYNNPPSQDFEGLSGAVGYYFCAMPLLIMIGAAVGALAGLRLYYRRRYI
jgi:H+/gluconate symporter-like permease